MTGRILIDTNVIARYLVADQPQHARAAAKLFEACDRGQARLVLLPHVLCECVFVLESFYEHPRDQIAAVLKRLIASPGVDLPDRQIHLDALDRYARGKLHFVDCALTSHAIAAQTRLATFDKDLAKLAGVDVVVPD